jgi:hypothetical protein
MRMPITIHYDPDYSFEVGLVALQRIVPRPAARSNLSGIRKPTRFRPLNADGVAAARQPLPVIETTAP